MPSSQFSLPRKCLDDFATSRHFVLETARGGGNSLCLFLPAELFLNLWRVEIVST